MGLIPIFPGGANVTGNIAITLVLALCTFIAVNVWGNKAILESKSLAGCAYMVEVPVPLMPVVELFGDPHKAFRLDDTFVLPISWQVTRLSWRSPA